MLIVALAGSAMLWKNTRQETECLAVLFKTSKITKVQFTDRLNIKHIELVGKNSCGDAVFAYYLHLADARTRYRQDPGKPGKTPVFTNFLMKLYGLPPL